MTLHHRNRAVAGAGGAFVPNATNSFMYELFDSEGVYMHGKTLDYTERAGGNWGCRYGNSDGQPTGGEWTYTYNGGGTYARVTDCMPNWGEMVAGGYHYIAKQYLPNVSNDWWHELFHQNSAGVFNATNELRLWLRGDGAGQVILGSTSYAGGNWRGDKGSTGWATRPASGLVGIDAWFPSSYTFKLRLVDLTDEENPVLLAESGTLSDNYGSSKNNSDDHKLGLAPRTNSGSWRIDWLCVTAEDPFGGL